MRKLQNQRIKKRGKIAAILLSVLCCLTMVVGQGQVVKAADPTNTPVPQRTASVIDTSKKGSLTIHKYEFDGTEGTGTGSDTDTVPLGATPLKDVEFTMYPVTACNTATNLQKYYNGEITIPSTEASHYYNGGSLQDVDTGTAKTATTGDDGIAYFGNLELGIYLVVESSAPAKVTEPMEPFLVSIPMTASNGKEWLYDVHVFPKNKTKTVSVTLLKQGTDGKNTQPLKDVEFVLQNEVSAGTWETAKNANGDVLTPPLKTLDDGTLPIPNLAPGKYRFVETSIGTNYGYIMDGSKIYEFEITVDGDIKVGGTTVNTAPHITVTDYKPTLEKTPGKKIAGDTQANYTVNDVVPFTLTITIPENIENMKVFEVSDIPKNMAFVEDSDEIIVTPKGGGINVTLTRGTDYTITRTATGSGSDYGFKIEFTKTGTGKYDVVKLLPGGTMTITYKAELLDGANMTKDGNVNTATVTYSKNIAPVTPIPGIVSPDPDTTIDLKDESIVYTFQLEIDKQNESSGGLKGAKFDIYAPFVEHANPTISIVPNATITGIGIDTDGGNKKYYLKEQVTSPENGKITIDGVSNGTYYAVEVEAPTGYNLLSKPVEIVVGVTPVPAMANPTPAANTLYTKQIDTANSSLSPLINTNNGGKIVTIKNSKGFILPQTGGAGGFLLTVVGCGVMILGIVLFHKSRDNKKEEAA